MQQHTVKRTPPLPFGKIISQHEKQQHDRTNKGIIPSSAHLDSPILLSTSPTSRLSKKAMLGNQWRLMLGWHEIKEKRKGFKSLLCTFKERSHTCKWIRWRCCVISVMNTAVKKVTLSTSTDAANIAAVMATNLVARMMSDTMPMKSSRMPFIPWN